jgi:serine/threonine protein kinase
MTTPDARPFDTEPSLRTPLDLLAEELERIHLIGLPLEREALAGRYGVEVEELDACWAAVAALASAVGAGASDSLGGRLPVVGERLGSYRIEEELARGGCGVVYRVSDSTGRPAALKLLLRVSAHHKRRLAREADALARLEHPNIVRIQKVAVHQRRPYLVLDLVEGGSLQERLHTSGPLDAREAASITRKVALALSYVHSRGVVHRDMKPENVLLNSEGEPLITDFGLVRELDPTKSRLTRTGSYLGTPGFWPPEQAAGELDRVGPWCDVYSLGATLYALLTGEPPFTGQTVVELLIAATERRPEPPSGLRPGLDPQLDRICLRCLEKEPADRYASAAELAQALDDFLRGPPSGPSAARLVLAAATLLVAGVSAGILSETFRSRAKPEPSASEALMVAPPPTSPSPPQRPGEALFASAMRSAERNELSDSAALLREVIRLEPTHPDAHAELGLILVKLRDLSEALQALDEALRRRPDHLRALESRSIVHLLLGDPETAEAEAKRVLAVAPLRLDALHTRGMCEAARGALREAVGTFGQVLKIDPSSRRSLVNRGPCRMQLGDVSGCLEDLNRALTLPGERTLEENRKIFLGLGLAYREEGQRKLAAEAFTTARSLYPPGDPISRQLAIWVKELE